MKTQRRIYESMKEIGDRIRQDVKNLWQAAVAIAVYAILVNLLFHNFCPMVIVTGLPCPGCGMTRALFFLVTGRLQQSIQINPMGIPVACIFLYFCINRYIAGKKAKGIMPVIVITAVMMLALYVYRMYSFFPDRVPYVYTEGNVMERIFPYYEQAIKQIINKK